MILRSKVKVTEVKTNFKPTLLFPPVWIRRWLRNDAQSLKWHRRDTSLLCKVISQISRSQGQKESLIWPWFQRFWTITPSSNSQMVIKWYSDQRSRSQRSKQILNQLCYFLLFEFTDGCRMMHKAWSVIEEILYYYARSSVKFQGHRAKKITNMTLISAFPDNNSSSNSQMAIKWYSELGGV